MVDRNLPENESVHCINFSEFAKAFLHGESTRTSDYTNYPKHKPSRVNSIRSIKKNDSRSHNNAKAQFVNNFGISLYQAPDPYFQHLIWTYIHGPHFNVSTLVMYPNPSQRKTIFDELEQQVMYLTDSHSTKVKIHGKLHSIPRKQAAFGNALCFGKKVTYTYSGLKLTPRPWNEAPILDEIRLHLNDLTGIEYNFVLVNRYENGRDKMGEHKDDEEEIDVNVPIASLTFGQERPFTFKHQKASRRRDHDLENLTYTVVLKDGMLLLMNRPTNQFWYHGIPRQSLDVCPEVRVNLTFRKILEK